MIDIGANLSHDTFDADRDDVLSRAWDAGLTHIVVTGASADGNEAAVRLAATDQRLSCTAGVHPHHADEYTPETDARIRELVNEVDVVATGEAGLDYFRDFSPRPAQHRAFSAQLEVAVDHGTPVFMHQRDAHQDFVSILKEYRDRLGSAVVHCFTGNKAELFDYLDMDLHVGITGWICDERRGEHLKSLVHNIPPGRLMIETDAPYLLPRDLKLKTRRNEPMHLPHIANVIAESRGETAEDLVAHTTATAQAFFQLAESAE